MHMKSWHIEIEDHPPRIDSDPGAADTDITLAEWLESHGIHLNTRCGKRGICKGCSVLLDSNLVKSCEVQVSDMLDSPASIRVPRGSIRDHSLHGVSQFELCATSLPPRIHAKLPLYGLALDIGTTTLAAALWNLGHNKMLAHRSIPNEQRRFGDNVISRIEHASKGAAQSGELHDTLLRASIQPLIRELSLEAGIAEEQIQHVIATGNTVMLHTLFGASIKGFGTYPFHPVFLDSQKRPGTLLGLSSNCQLETPPNLGAFVGSDITAGALACGLLETPPPVLLVDFGTNGEMLLKTEQGLYATATAAGPAFEGGRLCCGATAGDKVVSKLEKTPNGWTLHNPSGKIIDEPTGISGAAYVSLLALLREQEVINLMGRMNPQHPWVSSVPANAETDVELRIHLTDAIYLTEGDTAEIMQAKSAIAAGIATLCQHAGVQPHALRTVCVAGGFGFHLDIPSAQKIGLLPLNEQTTIRVVGNASLAGASLLLQYDGFQASEWIKNNCEVLELNTLDSFADAFLDCMLLEPLPL